MARRRRSLGRRPHPSGDHHHEPLGQARTLDRAGASRAALYAHKVTVDRAYGGQGLGAELLDWAGTRAADEGADWLRVDVWTTNERLQHDYLRQGFTYVRTVVLPHNPSGALFQRPAQRCQRRGFMRLKR
jgi:GNAT superfamily N-acetyltransferase